MNRRKVLFPAESDKGCSKSALKHRPSETCKVIAVAQRGQRWSSFHLGSPECHREMLAIRPTPNHNKLLKSQVNIPACPSPCHVTALSFSPVWPMEFARSVGPKALFTCMFSVAWPFSLWLLNSSIPTDSPEEFQLFNTSKSTVLLFFFVRSVNEGKE